MEPVQQWYTKDFMTTTMLSHLKAKGYVVKQQETFSPEKAESLLLAYKWGDRSIIEIKGYTSSFASADRKEMFQKTLGETTANWFYKNMLSSLLSLARQYKNTHLPVSLCLPDLVHHREILEKVQEYFTGNNLHLKVYLVRQDMTVEELNLNTRNAKKVMADELVKENNA